MFVALFAYGLRGNKKKFRVIQSENAPTAEKSKDCFLLFIYFLRFHLYNTHNTA